MSDSDQKLTWTNGFQDKITCTFQIEWQFNTKVLDDLSIKEIRSAAVTPNFDGSSWYFLLKAGEYNISVYLCKESGEKNVFAQFNYICKSVEVDGQYGNVTSKNNFFCENGNFFLIYLDKSTIRNYQLIIADVLLRRSDLKLLPLPNFTPVEASYKDLLVSGLFSDLTFCVGGKEFKVHKGILASRCEYFKVMFTGNLVESVQDKIDITDVEPDVFEAILQFVYSGQLPIDYDDITKDLLIAADKYNLQKVVTQCEQVLCQNVNKDNCVELLIFADKYNQKSLRNFINLVIQNNLREVTMSDEWQELKKINLELAVQTIENAVQQIRM